MPETKHAPPQAIPEEILLARLNRSEEMREFFIQMWIQNPQLAKQGGTKVRELLSQGKPPRQPD